MFPVISTQGLLDRLDALLAEFYPPTATEALCKLYQNDAYPDANMTLATFEESDVEGYTAVELVMTPPSINDQGLVVSKSNLVNVNVPADAAPQTVYGVFITNHDGTQLIAAQRFTEPQNLGGSYPTAISGIWRTSEPMTNYGWVDAEA